jgi:hypothetical protein
MHFVLLPVFCITLPPTVSFALQHSFLRLVYEIDAPRNTSLFASPMAPLASQNRPVEPEAKSCGPAARNPAFRSASFHVLECAPPRLLVGVRAISRFPLAASVDTRNGALKTRFTSARNQPFTTQAGDLTAKVLGLAGALACPPVHASRSFTYASRDKGNMWKDLCAKHIALRYLQPARETSSSIRSFERRSPVVASCLA